VLEQKLQDSCWPQIGLGGHSAVPIDENGKSGMGLGVELSVVVSRDISVPLATGIGPLPLED